MIVEYERSGEECCLLTLKIVDGPTTQTPDAITAAEVHVCSGCFGEGPGSLSADQLADLIGRLQSLHAELLRRQENPKCD